MDVEGIDHAELAGQAKLELDSHDLPDSSKEIMGNVIDALVDIQRARHYRNYSYDTDFVLRLSDVPQDLFNQFSKSAKLLGVSVGRLINAMMLHISEKGSLEISAQDLMEFFPKNTLTIQHIKKLVIRREDLEEIESVAIQHVQVVEFAEDVDEELFKEKVQGIQHCRTIKFNSSIPKLALMFKSQFCKNYVLPNVDLKISA